MLELRGGAATVVGLVGATVSFDPWSRLTLGGGLGASPAGVQLGAFARVRPLVFMGRRWARLHAIGLELGYSTGPFKDFILPVDGGSAASTYSWDNVQWLQPQLTYETRSYRGFNLLVGAGVAIPVAKHGFHCLDEMQCRSSPIGVLPTVTVGVAWAFGI
jgi:hypothetical protein